MIIWHWEFIQRKNWKTNIKLLKCDKFWTVEANAKPLIADVDAKIAKQTKLNLSVYIDIQKNYKIQLHKIMSKHLVLTPFKTNPTWAITNNITYSVRLKILLGLYNQTYLLYQTTMCVCVYRYRTCLVGIISDL